MCPKPNKTENLWIRQSTVHDYNMPVPGLFQALTTDPDSLHRWTTFTFPVDLDVSLFQAKQEKEPKYHMRKKFFHTFLKIKFN